MKQELRLRVLKYIASDELDAAVDLGILTGFGESLLRIGGVKLFADGTLGSRSAHLLRPYNHEPDNYGMTLTSAVELSNRAQKAARAGFSVAIHAVGDAAVRTSLNALEAALEAEAKNPRFRPAFKHRLEHVQLVSNEDWHRLINPRIAISVQPSHVLSDMQMADDLWGAPRTRLAYPYYSLMKAGALLLFGSDFPIEKPCPLDGIFAAVTRRRKDGFPAPDGWHKEERVPVGKAIKAYTLYPAVFACEQHRSGALEPGKLADIIALSHDITTIDPFEIRNAKVDLTVFDGKVVFRRNGTV